MTDWFALYEERKAFRRRNMRGMIQPECDQLAFMDVTRAMQDKDGIDHKVASRQLTMIIERRSRPI